MSRRGSRPVVAMGLVLVIVGAIGMGLTAPSASAQDEPGSGFGTFNLTADAQAVKVIGPDPSILVYMTDRFYNPDDEGRIPYNDLGIHYDWETQHK